MAAESHDTAGVHDPANRRAVDALDQIRDAASDYIAALHERIRANEEAVGLR